MFINALGLTLNPQIAHARREFSISGVRTWTVDDNGPADFHFIQQAIDAASNWDTIFVKNGIYYEHLGVNKTLTLIAESKNDSVVDAGFAEIAINITANGAWIDDLAIRNAAQNALSIFGDNNRVSGVTIYSTAQGGFPKHQTGIDIHSSRNIIEKCAIFDSQHAGIAITVSPSDGKDASGNKITGNEMARGANGIVLWDWQIPSSPSVYGNRIIGNTIHDNHNSSVGIYLHMTYGNTVAYNVILNNDGGICLDNSFSASGSGNVIHHNSFVNNTLSVIGTVESYNNAWDDGSEGNYWSDYTGIDANGDGIGDSAYILDELNRDNYPLMVVLMQGDANHDGIVNIGDVSLFALSWLSRKGESRYNSHVDFNLDGSVNISDAAMIGVNWQKRV